MPPPRFTTGILKEGDVDFCYGSKDGQLWPILNEIFNLNLSFETTEYAVTQRKEFLKEQKIGICDIVESAERLKIDASDLGMKNVVLRDVIGYLKLFKKVDTLLFTGGNSKNGPEYFFRNHLKNNHLKLIEISCDVPRIHSFELEGRIIKTVSLTAPSGAANRAIGGLETYKILKNKNPKFNTINFRILQYAHFFKD